MEEQIRNYQKILKSNPIDLPAFTALEEIYQGKDRWRELVELYEERIRHVQDNAQRLGLHEKCAGIWLNKLSDANRAERCYRRVLRIDPDSRAALAGLEEVYTRRSDWRRLAEVLEKQSVITVDAVARAAIFHRLGILYRDELKQRDHALVAFGHALTVNPKQIESLQPLRELHAELGYFDKVKELIDREAEIGLTDLAVVGGMYLELGKQLLGEPLLEQTCRDALEKAREMMGDPAQAEASIAELERIKADPDAYIKQMRVQAVEAPDKNRAVDLYRRIAELYFLKGGHDKEVEENLDKCALLQPDNPRLLAFIERYYLKNRRHKDLLDRLNSMVTRIKNPKTATVLIERIAMLTAVHTQDRKATMDAYMKILCLEPGHPSAVASLVEYYQEEGRWAEVVELLKGQVERQPDLAARAYVLFQIARITSEQLKDPEAARFLYEEILRLDESNLEAARALARSYEKAKDFNGLVRCLEIQLDHMPDIEGRLAILDQIAELNRDKRNDPVSAFLARLRAVAIDPSQKKIIRDVINLGQETGRFQEMATGLQSALDSDRLSGQLRLEVLSTMADVYEKRLNNTSEAIKIYEEILSQDPKNMPALDALERLQAGAGGSVELIGIYSRQLDLVRSGEKKKELLFKLADIYQERMADYRQAAATYRQIIEIDENEILAWSRLADLHEREGQWPEAAEALERSLAGVSDPAQKRQYSFRLASVYEQRLNDTEKALKLCSAILAAEGLEQELAAKTVTILERLQGRGVSPMRIAEILQPYYALSGDWRRHIDMLELRLEGCNTPEERVHLLGRIAQVYEEELEQKELAFSAAARAFRWLPGDPSLLANLQRLADETGRLEDLTGTIENALRSVEDEQRIIALNRALGALYRDRLNRPQNAIACFQRMLEMVPDDEESMESLAGLFQTTQRWGELSEVLRLRVQNTSDPALGKQLMLELGQVMEDELHDRPSAIAIYEQLHEGLGDDIDVLRRLEKLLEKEGRWPDLAGVLERMIPLIAQDEAAELQLKLGRVRAERMEEREHAVEHYRQVLQEKPGDERAIEALESLMERPDSAPAAAEILQPIYEQSSDWGGLVRVLEVRAEIADDPERRVETLKRVAEICDRQLGQLDRSFSALRRAFRVDPSRQDVLQYMQRLADKSGAYEGLTAALEESIDSQGDVEHQVFRLQTLAGIYRDVLRRSDLAMASLRRLLDFDPKHASTLASLDAMYRDAKAYQDLAWVLVKQAEVAAAPEKRRDLLVQAAQIQEEQLGDLDSAVASYQQVFSLDESDIHAAKQLDRLYQATNRWEEQAALLPKLAQLTKNVLGAIDYSNRLADIYAAQLDDPAKAVQIYQQILQQKPGHPGTVERIEKLLADERCRLGAAEALEGVYRSRSEWRKLAAILEMRLNASTEPAERLGYFAQLKDLYENKIDELALAYNTAARAFREQPADEGVRKDLFRLAEVGDFFDELVSVYSDVAEKHVGTELAIELRKQIAWIEERHLHKRAEAIAQWEQLLESNASEPDVLSALERLYREEGNFPSLVEIYRRQVDLTEEEDKRKDLLFQMAATLAEGVEDLDAAVSVYHQILDLAPDDRRALRLLDELLVSQERWADLSSVIEHEVTLVSDKEPAEGEIDEGMDLLLRLAHLYKDRLGSPDKALGALQAAMQRDPSEERTVSLIESLLTDASIRVAAAELLEPAYRKAGEHRKLVAIMEVRLAALEDGAERLAIYRELALLYEQELSQKPLAFMVVCRAFRENLQDEGVRAELERLAQETGSFEELASVYEEIMPRVEGSEIGAQIGRRLAQLTEAYLDDKDEAVSHWRQVLANDPDDMEALKSLERLYRERAAFPELVGILRHMATMEKDLDRKKDLLHEVATLMEERLGRNDGAIDAYKEILSEDPNDVTVLRLVDRLLAREGRHEELQTIIEMQIERAEGSDLAALTLRLGVLLREQLKLFDNAVTVLGDLLTLQPGHPEAVAALVSMFDAGEAKEEAARVLVVVLEPLEDWRHLIAALETLHDASEEDVERKQALMRIAEIYETKLEQKELAFNVLGRAFQADPSDEEVRSTLERLAAETEEYELLAAIYFRRLEGLEDKGVTLAIHRRLARLFVEKLGDAESAVDSLEAIVELDPHDQASMMVLERFYRDRKDHDALIEILRRRLKMAGDPEQASPILYEIARIHEQQGDLGGAIQAYREVLERTPGDLAALELLDRLCGQQGRHKEQAEVLVSRIGVLDQSGQIAESLDLRFRLAQLYEQEFGDMERAGRLYQDILQANPTHEATIQHLESIMGEGRSFEGANELMEAAYGQTGDWKKYIEILEGQVRQSRVMARRLELLRAIAKIQEEKLGMAFMAFNTYVRMFHEDLSDSSIRDGMERLATEDDNLEALAAVYEEQLDNIEEPEVGAAIALKVAEIQREQLDDEEEAVRFYRAALRFQPRHLKALAALELAYEKREEWENLVDILSREVDLVIEPEDRVRVLYKMGAVMLERLEQSSKAVGYFRRALDIQPDHVESLKLLERAFAEQGEHEQLYDVLKSRLELSHDADERVELVARIGDLAAGVLERPGEAVDLWKQILVSDPGSEDAFEALDRLFERTERWAELASLIENRMGRTADPEKIADLSSRLGWVKGEKLGELEDAMKNWQEVLRLDPKNEQALQALRGIYNSSGQWDKLLAVLRKLVPLQEDMTGVKRIRFELAEILGEKLGRCDEAIEAAKRALDIEPHTAADLSRLGRVFEANEAWQDAVSVLEQSVEIEQDTAEKIDLLLQVASLWKDKISRPLGAAPAYEKILELEPFHEEAYRVAQDIYRSSKEWRRLTNLLENRLGHIRERRDRLELMKEIADIYESHLAQKELAFARYCAAFREDFSDDLVLSKLETLAEETEDYDTLLEVLEDATTEVTTGRRAVGLLQKIADIYHGRLSEDEKAEEYLKRAVELDRQDISSLDSLATLYEEQERYDDLIRILEKKYERSDELDQRKSVRSRIARLQEENLDRVDLAIDSYRRILELDGRDKAAIQSLIRLNQMAGRWEELITILRRAADQADERSETIQYLHNIASIWETELDMDEEAIDAYRDVLEFEPTHLASLQSLERIYTRLDRWTELLQVFEQEVTLVDDREEKIKIYNKMASIWEERFSSLERAAACHEAVLEIEPGNLHAIKALERLVERMGDYSHLIELYYMHIDLIDDRSEIVDIHLAIGEVWYRELSRVDKAEDVFTKALEIDDHSKEAIHALGQLYEKSGNWFNAIEMLQREAELCGATPEAVDLFYRMGKINEDMLLDSSASREAYSRALAIDPSYLPAIKALKLIHFLDKEYERYLEMMVQEAEHTEDIEEKTRLFYEIGKFLQEQQDDSGQAATYYEEALHRTPDYMPAAKPLADIFFRSEQWERAEKMMEVVVAGLDRNTEARELCRQYYRLGYITEKLGKEDKALEHYRMSYELDATYLPALEGLGNALIKTEQWEDAYRIYQTILIHHRDSLSDAEVAELYWQLGDVNYQMQEIERAIGSFAKALEIDEGHLASLQYLVRIHEQEQNWEEAYDYGMQMVDSLDEDDLFEHYVRMGDLCRDKLQDPFRAVDAFQSAMQLRSDSLEVMTRLLDLFVETRQYPRAADILDRILQVEGRPSKLVEYNVQLAEILRDELRDEIRAVEHFNRVLDIDPSYVQAFQALSEILSRRKDWPALKDNYIKMIKRLPGEARKTKLALWRDLGELCRVVLRNLNESIDAYRMITVLDPEDADAMATLGDLLAAKQGGGDEAAECHHKVVSAHPDRIQSYRALWKLYNNKKEYDKVFVLTSILRYLKKADDEEQKIVQYFTRKAPQVESAKPITDAIWAKLLAHEDAKVPFTRIFGVMYNLAAPMFVREHKDIGLKRKEHQIDLARDRRLFTHSFRIAAKVMGGPNVELFAFKDRTSPDPDVPGLSVAPTRPTAVVAYRDMFAADKKKPLLFYIGRQLAMTRPEFILVTILPKPMVELNYLLQAACLLVNSRYEVQDEAQVVPRMRKLKKSLDDKGFGILRSAVSEYLKKPREYNLKSWVEAVEHSVNRAGMVVCNDISVSLAILRREKTWLSPMRPVTKAMELLKYISSSDYFKLREVLGLNVST